MLDAKGADKRNVVGGWMIEKLGRISWTSINQLSYSFSKSLSVIIQCVFHALRLMNCVEHLLHIVVTAMWKNIVHHSFLLIAGTISR
jgi:hypothetical protein